MEVGKRFNLYLDLDTFKCARALCKTCPFIRNVDKISGPKRSITITDHFTCTSANVIYCITCTFCKTLYIGETGRRLDDRFLEHLCDVEKDDQNASKPVPRHFNIPNHSKQHMAVCGVSFHQGSTESRKTLEQKFIFKSALLILTVLTNAFHSTNLFRCLTPYQAPANSVAPYFFIYTTHNP